MHFEVALEQVDDAVVVVDDQDVGHDSFLAAVMAQGASLAWLIYQNGHLLLYRVGRDNQVLEKGNHSFTAFNTLALDIEYSLAKALTVCPAT
jgi:hypothetical protein